MREMKVPAYFGFPSCLVFLLAALLISITATHTLLAQATPAAGTSVVVKMVDAVDSGSDPAGKQYRASVTKAVTDANGVTIAQGAPATVTLASSASGWTAQLASVTINGQTVAVSSSSAIVTSAAQSAANAVGSVLSGLGRPRNVPPSVTAVATGQRVVLPPGTTLSFVLGATASPNAPPAAANATPAAAPAVPVANAAPRPAAALAPGQGTWYQCRSWGEKGTHQTVYVTPFIHTDAAASTIHQSYYTYMHATYPVDKLGHESDFCRQASADPGQQAFSLSTQEKQWASSNPPWEVIHINWTYTPAEVAATNAAVASATTAAAVPTAAANQNYVWCNSAWAGTAGTMMPAGTVMYFSDVFAATAPPPPPAGEKTGNGWGQRNAAAALQTPFFAFLQKKYGYKDAGNYPVECRLGYPPTAGGLQSAQKARQQFEDLAKQNRGQIVETGWQNQ
jgi:hypothetical protein